jgi:hypothetical protein
VIRLITGLSSGNAVNILGRLDAAVTTACSQLRINGKGKPTPVADACTLVSLIWELPGRTARVFRRQSAHLVARYLGADRSLIEEIEARFERVSPQTQTFLLAHVERPEIQPLSEEQHERTLKRKRADLELAEVDARLRELEHREKERQLEHDAKLVEYDTKIKEQHVAHETKVRQLQEEGKGQLVLTRTRLANDTDIQRLMGQDAHVRSVFNDYVKQSMMLLTYGASGTDSQGQHDFCSDFTTLCQEMGYGLLSRSQLIALGKHVAGSYRSSFQLEPETTVKYTNGANRTVKTYRLCHLAWLKGEIRASMGVP